MSAKSARYTKLLLYNVIILILLTALPLVAQPGQGPCKSDAQQLCAGVAQGGGRIRKCLKQNETNLSVACRQRLASWDAARAKIRKACKVDYAKHCLGKKGGAVMQCLLDNLNDLSPACRAVVSSAPGS